MTRAVFVETAAAAGCAETKAVGTLVVSTRESVVDALHAKGAPAVWVGSAASPEEIRAAYASAYRTAGRWFLDPSVGNALDYRGVNLAECARVPFGSGLARLLSDGVRLRRFVSAHGIRHALVLRDDPGPCASFYVGSTETAASVFLRAFGVDVQEDVVQAAGRAPAADGPARLLKALISGFTPAWTPPVRDGAAVLFSGAPHLLESVLAENAKSRPAVWFDEALQIRTRNKLKGTGVGYLRFDAWTRSTPAHPERARFLDRLRSRTPEILRAFAEDPANRFDGVDSAEAAVPRLRWFLERRAPALAVWVDVFHRLFDVRAIDAVVVDEDALEFRRALVRVAAVRGVPSLVLLHATTPSFCEGFDIAPLGATRIAVGGEGLKKDCVRWGIDPARVVVNGVPRYESFAAAPAPARPKPLLAFAATYYNVLFDPRGDRRDIERACRDLFTAAAVRRDKLDLVVKRYPRDPDPEWIARLAAESGLPDVQFAPNGDERDLSAFFGACDFAATFPSGALTEAFLLGRPTLVLGHLSRLSGVEALAPCREFTASDAASVGRVLDAFLAGDAADRAREAGLRIAREWAGETAGAAARVAAAVEELAGGRGGR